MKKVFYLGTPEFAANVLEKLLEKNISISKVISMPDKPQGRGYIVQKTPVKLIAEKYNIECLQPANKQELVEIYRQENPDLSIVVAYGFIFPDEIVNNYYLTNIHTSLLPYYRGPAPMQLAILNGDTHTGVTFMKVSSAVDSGDIIDQEEITIEESDNVVSLSKKLAELSIVVLERNLNKDMNEWVLTPQNHERASFTKKITKNDGYIHFEIDSKPMILRKIRAFYPWPGVFTFIDDKRVKICEAEIKDDDFIIKKVQVEGKNPIDYESYLKGNPPLI